MTYTEWRDELKSNLMGVSESERRRVLEYYAEAYADRREAGFSEWEIIQDFGAPYDAAQRILDLEDGGVSSKSRDDHREREAAYERRRYQDDEFFDAQPARESARPQRTEREIRETKEAEKKPEKEKHSWLFIFFCIIFAVPIFMIVMSLSIMTLAFFAAPFAVLLSGVWLVISGVGMTIASGVVEGLINIGLGIMAFGAGVVLVGILPRFAKFAWKVFLTVGGWLKKPFSSKEA